jgi:hypothetical protein
MRSVGVLVRLRSKGRPAAYIVALDGTWSNPVFVDAFELTSVHTDISEQLYDLATGLSSHLAGLNADRVVVRRADRATTPSNSEGPRVRLLAEGALTAAARAAVGQVVLLNGKDLAILSPAANRDALDAHAAAKLQDLRADVAAAALVGLAV